MSSTPRLFVTSDLAQDGFVAVDEGQAKYLSRVMRLRVGDGVRVFNGRDGEWDAVIDHLEGKTLLLKAKAQRRTQADGTNLTLLFAPLKKTRTDFVVEKATELGVAAIQPVFTARTQATRVNTERLQALAMEAAEQTERMDLPLIRPGAPLPQALDDLSAGVTLYFCDEAGDEEDAPWGGGRGRARPMVDVLAAREIGPAAILIGPEGGFSPEERRDLRQRTGTVPVGLGPRILRAETAAVAALTLWQAEHGDWRGLQSA